jgi:ubiquinone/menaquinone biosynthesis C-methylase UbiE
MDQAQSVEGLAYTGERMVPSGADALTFWEHVERYRFARAYAPNHRVLDIACGEGYGTAALAEAGAASVIGVDISPETVEHARRKYGVDARVGSATDIPLADASIDLVISFETVEHIEEPEKFLQECHRVLCRGGVAIISTPNPELYGKFVPANDFHCSEMSPAQFLMLLGRHFNVTSTFGQSFSPHGWGRIRGMGRLQAGLMRLLAPSRANPLSEGQRARVCSLIAEPRPRLASAVVHEAVRSARAADLKYAKYVIALARKP